eukprot:CAMPEP_0114548608 /NCGR_PEP_ID=MMETSP0114-20121206/5074_1 /TAXON_ID=31324 /ORGANISM="Goniomonas sp, Strain m" /LENGTH=365 /DNA_ID=CAMNT_0001733213 /DNA_START=196 /DNA_END=1293 /DNA_ORIENTATION=-
MNLACMLFALHMNASSLDDSSSGAQGEEHISGLESYCSGGNRTVFKIHSEYPVLLVVFADEAMGEDFADAFAEDLIDLFTIKYQRQLKAGNLPTKCNGFVPVVRACIADCVQRLLQNIITSGSPDSIDWVYAVRSDSLSSFFDEPPEVHHTTQSTSRGGDADLDSVVAGSKAAPGRAAKSTRRLNASFKQPRRRLWFLPRRRRTRSELGERLPELGQLQSFLLNESRPDRGAAPVTGPEVVEDLSALVASAGRLMSLLSSFSGGEPDPVAQVELAVADRKSTGQPGRVFALRVRTTTVLLCITSSAGASTLPPITNQRGAAPSVSVPAGPPAGLSARTWPHTQRLAYWLDFMHDLAVPLPPVAFT